LTGSASFDGELRLLFHHRDAKRIEQTQVVEPPVRDACVKRVSDQVVYAVYAEGAAEQRGKERLPKVAGLSHFVLDRQRQEIAGPDAEDILPPHFRF